MSERINTFYEESATPRAASGTIWDEYWRQRSDLIEAGKVPHRVTFSREGELKMRKEAVGDRLFDPATYGGLPWTTLPWQAADIIVLTERQAAADASAVVVSLNSTDPESLQLQVIGHRLTKAQLCDVIMAWVDAHPDDHWFRNQLIGAVQAGGCFE